MYATRTCPYCIRAEALLKGKGINDIEKILVDNDAQLRAQMTRESGGGQTVPQIFINGVHVGGCDDIHALDYAGKLDDMLAADAE